MKKKSIALGVSLMMLVFCAVIVLTICVSVKKPKNESQGENDLSLVWDKSQTRESQALGQGQKKKYDQTLISLDDQNTAISGKNAVFENDTLKITGGGQFEIRGTLSGKIVVTSNDSTDVILKFHDTLISSKNAPAFEAFGRGNVKIIALPSNTLSFSTENKDQDVLSVCLLKAKTQFSGLGNVNIFGTGCQAVTADEKLNISCGYFGILCDRDGISAQNGISFDDSAVKIESASACIKTQGDLLAKSTTFDLSCKRDELFGSEGTAIKAENETDTRALKVVGKLDFDDSTLKIDTDASGMFLKSGGQIKNSLLKIENSKSGIFSRGALKVKNSSLTVTSTLTAISAPEISLEKSNVSIPDSAFGIRCTAKEKGELSVNQSTISALSSVLALDLNQSLSAENSDIICYSKTEKNTLFRIRGAKLENSNLLFVSKSALITGLKFPRVQAKINAQNATDIIIKKAPQGDEIAFALPDGCEHILLFDGKMKKGDEFDVFVSKVKKNAPSDDLTVSQRELKKIGRVLATN